MRSVARGPRLPQLLDRPAAGPPKSKKHSRTELAEHTTVAEMPAATYAPTGGTAGSVGRGLAGSVVGYDRQSS
jgi:hypothetical protein